MAVLVALMWGGTSARGSDWKLDPSFAEGGILVGDSLGAARGPRIAPLPDGGFYAANLQSVLSRFHEDGKLDVSFGGLGWANLSLDDFTLDALMLNDLALSKEGRPIIVGMAVDIDADDWDETYFPYMRRFLTGGDPDSSFAFGEPFSDREVLPYSPRFFTTMVVTGKGSLIVGGGEGQHGVRGKRPAATIRKFTPGGKLDQSFSAKGMYRLPARLGGGPYQEFTGLEMVGRGRILAAGYSRGRTLLTRLLPGGRRDRSFGGGDGVVAHSFNREPRCFYTTDDRCQPGVKLGVTRSGRIYVLDFTYRKGKGAWARLFAYSRSGRPVRSFGRNGRIVFRPFAEKERTFFPISFELGPRGDITLVGDRARLGERGLKVDSRLALLRLRPDGFRDRSFGDGGLLAGVIDAHHGRRVVEDFNGRLLVSGIRDNVRWRDPETDQIMYVHRAVVARLIPAP